jgi:hypothetical protein
VVKAALLTSTSILPNAASVFAISASISSSRATPQPSVSASCEERAHSGRRA